MMFRRQQFRALLLSIIPGLFFGGMGCYGYITGRQEQLNRSLVLAVNRGNTETVRTLLQIGADANTRYKTIKKIRSLLDFLRTWFQNPARNVYPTALILAADGRKTEIVQLLVEKGADVDATESGGGTALMFAAQRGDERAV